MLFQMLPVFLTVVAFVGIDGRTFGNSLQQRGQMVALMDIGGGDVQFLDIAFLIGTGMLFVTEFVEAVFLYLPYHSPRFLNSAGVQPKYSRNALVKLETWA